MASATTPMILSAKSEEAVIKFYDVCRQVHSSQWNMHSRMEAVDQAYAREVDASKEHNRAKISNRYGDSSKFQNVTVPVVMPQVESAVTYQTSVFLTGTPLFGVVASPQFIDEAMQMETVIEDQSVRGGWVRELGLAFRDGFKYNIAAVEADWARVNVASIETDATYANGTAGKPKETIWEGNSLKRLDMYNTFFDTRVPPAEIHKRGEFAGYTDLKSRIELKEFIESLPYKTNVKEALESTAKDLDKYYIPRINPDVIQKSQLSGSNTNWMQWAGLINSNQRINYKDIYTVTVLYAKIIPMDFGLNVPARNTPQIWKFIIVNGAVVIYSERQTNAHRYIPILFFQPSEDGLGFQTKSLAENGKPFQEITSAMWNSVIAARRRAISDRGLYDPSRVAEHHINSDNPAAKIPVRPAAYGKNIQEAYFPIPFRDDQSGVLMQESQQVLQMANMVSGQNQARQGQFVKGNKTRREFDTVMMNANGRDQTTALFLEAQFFTPLKEIIKINILQYQGPQSLFNRQNQRVVAVDPVKLRKAILEFKISDGLTPTDKLIDADTLQVSMQVIGSSPQIAAGYNIAPLFSYLMKTRGADLTPFEKSPEQLAYEQAVQSWQQVVLQLAQAKADPATYPSQPLPEQYGYKPQGLQGGATNAESQTRVNNITNNITNNEGQ